MNATVVCSHCNTCVPAGKYYEHLQTQHDEDED
jgi:hypothetical protein